MGQNDDICQTCPCACCPKYEELDDWADHLEEIAVRIERDEWFYLEVKADIVENGWESDYARIGISGYRDPTVPSQTAAALIQHYEGLPAEVIFAEDLTPAVLDNSVARPGLVRVIRERAANARDLAQRGLDYCATDASYKGQDADPVLDYFCTLDPDKIDSDVWGELYKIGYIDFATFDDVGYRVLSEKLMRAEMAASVAGLVFAFRSALVSLAKHSAYGLLRLTRTQAARLSAIGRRRMPNRVVKRVDMRRSSLAAQADNEAGIMNGFMGVGHAMPWSQMSAKARQAFQHSYNRHGAEFGLPAWKQAKAEELQTLFNAAVGQVRSSAHTVRIVMKPYAVRGYPAGPPARMTEFRATINGREFYYYELRDIGKFVSAGLAKVR